MKGLDLSSGTGHFERLHHDGYGGGSCGCGHHNHKDCYVTEDELRDYGKRGVAGAGLGLGIAGTALGVWNLWKDKHREGHGRDGYGRGEGYGYGAPYGYSYPAPYAMPYGVGVSNVQYCGGEGRREGGCCKDYIDKYELGQAEKIAEMGDVIAKERAERYAESGDFRNYREFTDKMAIQSKETDYRFAKVEAQICELNKNTAVAEAKIDGRLDVLKEALIDAKVAAKTELKLAFDLEAERRFNGDKELREWCECRFATTHKVIRPDQICPPVVLACPPTTTTTTPAAA